MPDLKAWPSDRLSLGRPLAMQLAAAAATLSSCNFAPPYVQPELPVPDRYAAQASQAKSAGSVEWNDFFRDEELRRLIRAAFANNRDIRIAAARVAEARGQWRIAGSALYPQLDAIAGGIKGKVPDDFTLSLPGTGVSTSGPTDKPHAIFAQLTAGWEIDFWGRLRNMKEAARQRYFATEEAQRAVATDLIAQVANGYLLEREYTERVALAKQTVATREESYRIMRRRYEEGYGNNLERKQAEMLLAEAQTSLEGLVQDLGVNHNELERLVGEPIVIAAGPLKLPEAETDIPAGLPSELLINRPDIVQAEYELRASNADIGAARAAFFPNIVLTGSLGSTSTDLDNLFSGGTHTWTFMPFIRLPLFNGGRLKGNLDVAKARQVEAVASYEKAVQGAFRDVANALVKRAQLQMRVATTQEQLAAAQERARLAQMRYDVGKSTYLEVLDAQRDLFDTQQQFVALQRAYLATAVELYSALGGGIPRATPILASSQHPSRTNDHRSQQK